MSLAVGVSAHASGQAQSDAQIRQAAMEDLAQFLNDPAARQAFTVGRPDAQQANAFFEKFPPYAQAEIMAIVMQVMQETAGNPKVAPRDVHATYGAFSPAVKARIGALQQRLATDRAFNSAANLQMMRRFFPAFLGAPAG